jgi:RHS repeat-associated protein
MRNRLFAAAVAVLALLVLPLGLALWAQSPPDTDPPQIRVVESGTDLTEGRLFNRAAAPAIQVTDASAVTVAATLDGTAFTSGATVSGEGTHLLAVTATDAAGNAASAAVGFEIDTTPPAFLEVQPPDDEIIADAQITLQGKVTGAATVTLDGQPATLVGQDFTAGPFALAEGVRTFAIVATDPAGNTAQRTQRITRDSQAPTVSIAQPALGAVLQGATVDVVGSAQDPHLASVAVNGIAATVTGTSWVARQVPLAEGSNSLVARAEDAAGNASEATRAVVRDSQPPDLAVTDPAPGTVVPGASITLRGTASDPFLDRVEVNGVRAQLASGAWLLAVSLTEGNNAFTVRAFDKVGNVAEATLSVLRDSEAPAVRIVQPADGARLNAVTVAVSGTVDREAGITVTVNGAAAAVTDGAFTAADVSLVEGENTLIARARDAVGNQGTHTRIVVRDTVAPRLELADPATGALALPVDTIFRLTFSEDMADVTAGSLRLETGAGQSLGAALSRAGEIITVRPLDPLPSSTPVRLVLTTGVKDLAGNALAQPPTLTFLTVDTTAPAAPVFDPAPARAVCAPSLELAGTAEAGALVRVAGGAAGAEARTDETGRFALSVQLSPGGLNRLRATATDGGGNTSPETVALVIHDCQPPRVASAERQGDLFRVTFTEPVQAAGLADAVKLAGGSGAVAGAVSLAANGLTATFTPSGALPAGALRLEVGTAVRDLAGNAMAFPWSQVFGAAGGSGFLLGTVIDDATGRPLAGARVLVYATNGTPLAEPLPEQVTGDDGRFRLPVPAGTHDLTIVRPGYTPCFRIVTTGAGQGTDVFDPRLTPAAKLQDLGPAGGSWGSGGEPALTLPAGALAATVPVAATRLDEQGLPALLPYGWSPRGAAWVELGGAALEQPGTLRLPAESPDGTSLTLVHLDLAALQWRVVGTGQVSGGRVEIALPAAGAGLTDGGWAAVEADDGPLAPPAPVAGAVLAASPRPAGDEPTGATLGFDPEVVLPAQSSRATAVYTLAEGVASGLPVTLRIEEELTLLDNSVRRQTPYQADLILYHAPDGTPRSRFQLRPSAAAQALPLKLGAEDVTLQTYGGEAVAGNVVGPEGGTVSGDQGDRIDLPAGAVTEPTAVVLTRKVAADLGLAIPAGTELAGVVDVDLNGKRLLVPAALSLALAQAPAAGEKGLLLQVIELEAGRAFRAVAALQPTASGWTTAPIDALDLAWPGVREEGLFAFVRLTGAFGYLRGTVFDIAGSGGPALAGALVRSANLGWVQVSNGDGSYVLPAPVSTLTVTAENRLTGNLAAGAAEIAAAEVRVDLDLHLQPEGPRVLQFTPADGAVDVLQGIQPTIRFSEPVEPDSAPGAVQLFSEGQPVAVDLEVQGALVRVKPRSTLLAGIAHELRVTSGVRDLQGNPLESPAAAHFTTLRVLASRDLDLSRVFLVAPDANGHARVLGRPGAVPAGALVFVENRSALAATPSVTADQDGSFDLDVDATLAHTLILHVLIAGSNEIVAKLTPFRTADLQGAYVDAQASSFTTGEGLTVQVPEGAFDGPTIVRIASQPAATSPPLARDAFAPVAAFILDFSGAEAHKPLEISLPLPAGAPSPVGGLYLLNRAVEALGERAWMMHDLMRLDSASGRLTTAAAPAGSAAFGIPPAAVVAALNSPFAFAAAEPQTLAKAAGTNYKAYLPGAAFPGQYQIEAPLIPLGFTVFPSFDMNGLVGIWSQGLEGIFATMNAKIAQLLEFDGLLIPARLGQPVHLVLRDLTTGFRLFDGSFDPPTGPDPIVLPRDVLGDHTPPFPLAGSPLRFFLLDPAAGGSQELDLGISMTLAAASANRRTLTVAGAAGATDPQSQVRLLGLDDDVAGQITSDDAGAFTLGGSLEIGHRYVLAIGAQVGSGQSIDISFSEALDKAFSGIEVVDPLGRRLAPQLEPVGSRETVRIRPSTGWEAGKTYTLRLGSALADDAGNRWGKSLEIAFKVAASRPLDTFRLDAVRDVARLGSLLFLAADIDGLVVLDASDPAHLTNAAGDGVKFPFPLNDAVRGVAVDPHGRVLVVGGGVNGFGQLKIFDPLTLSYQGSTILSDKLSGTGTELPAGTPRRVAVLSDDEKDEWTLGEAPPEGITAQVTVDPANGNATVVVAGASVAKHPVSLFDVALGRWRRVDAGADGHFEISLDVLPGDRLRLLRNRQTLAYVATQGAGVEVVDVDAFYREAEAPSSTLSDVLGIYSGVDDPKLVLCGQHEADLGSSLLDLDTLFDPDNLHQLTVAGLAGNRGLVLLESNAVSPGQVSFLNEQCAELEGSRAVSGLAVLQAYAFDLDGDGRLETSEVSDYVLVSHRIAGLLVFDVKNREDIRLVGKIKLPGSASSLAVDREHRRAFVSGNAEGLYIVDLDRPPRLDLLDANGDGKDDRVLETVKLTGNTNSVPGLLPELGLALAGGLQRGLTPVTVGPPLVQALARNGDGSLRAVDRLAPFGVPTAKESSAPDAPDLPGAFAIQAHLPGTLGPVARLDVVSLGPGGKEIDGLGNPETLPGLPRTSLTGERAVVLRRLSDNRYDEGYNLYRSQEIAVLADVRAARAYVRTAKETADCSRCDLPAGQPLELLAGDRIAIRFPAALRTQLASIYTPDRLEQAEIEIGSVRWETVPSLQQEPALSPSLGRGEAVPGTLLHSGEMSLQPTDVALKGRGFDLAFTRTFRSQTIGAGPLGPGWDFSYHQRLRELPNGDVELFDGRGRRERFHHQADGTLVAPKGVFVTLERTAAGWVLVDPGHNLFRFDRFGRLLSIADAVKDARDTGNEMRFGYDLASRLVRITDSLDRDSLLSYDARGRLTKVTDPTGREVTYQYDAEGRLQSVTSPKIETGESKFPAGLTTRYAYTAASGALAALLTQRDNLASVTDPRNQKWLELVYADGDGDGRADEVTSQVWGPGTVQLAYNSSSRETTVTDRRGHATKVQHDAAGHPTRIEDPAAAVTTYQYDDEGLITSMTEPLGRVTAYTYDAGAARRSRGNPTRLQVTAGTGGANGSDATLTTTITYEPRTNQPTRLVDPRGTVTEITRDALGQPTRIAQATGKPEESVTQIAYNASGQPLRVTNANGHVTAYHYFEGGPRRGYLEGVTVDEGGLNLATHFDVDVRGNPLVTTDARGIQHHRTWNEVDWLVETREPLGLYETLLYDAGGNVVEQRTPVHDGTAFTAVRATYGPLGEVLSVAREIEPGGAAVTEQYAYDSNLNLIQSTAPAGQVTRWTYDDRNLPVEVELGAGTADAATVTSAYDAEGHRTTTTDGRNATWTTVYDGFGRVQETADPLGNKARISYDNAGNPVDRKALDANQQLLAEEEAVFDPLSRLAIQRGKLWADQQAARNVETRVIYDPLGNVLSQIDPLQRETRMSYDAAERLVGLTDPAGNVTELALDPTGNVLSTTLHERLPEGGSVDSRQSTTYDELNRPVTTTDPMGNTAQAIYDVRGNLLLSLDPEGNGTANTYDGLDRLAQTVQPEGIAVTYGYDAASRLVSYQDAAGHETRWAYDALDRRTSTTYPDNKTEVVTYDQSGNVVGFTDPLQTQVAQTFDLAGRLTARTVTPGANVVGPLSETYAYDGLGRLTRAESGGVVTDRQYDSFSRLLSETSAGKTVSYALDDVGNPLRIGYPSGPTIHQSFDPLDLPQRIATAPTSGTLATYGWRGLGLPVKKDFGNGLSGTAQFDLAGRKTREFLKDPTGGGAFVFDENLTWNSRDLLIKTRREDLNGAAWHFAYDKAGRLAAAGRTTKQDAQTGVLDLAAITGLPSRVKFRYDNTQNLVERDVQITPAPASPSETRLESLPVDPSGRNRPAEVAGIALTWDANGNLIAKGNLRFQYDYRNRLTQVTDALGASVATYAYDAFNRRVARTVGNETHAIVWNGWQPIEEYKNGQLTSRRTYGAGLDEIVQLETHLDSAQADTYVPLYDHAGNLIAATGLNGKAIERYAYSTYGVAKVRVDSAAREEQLALRKGTALWLLGSEEVSDAALAQAVADHSLKLEAQESQTSAAVALKDSGTWQPLDIEVTQPAVNESQEDHRIVITPVGEPIAEGAQLRLTVPPSALTDLFLNQPAQPFELTFAWPADDGVVFDSTAASQSAAFAALKTGSTSEIGDSIEPPDDRDSPGTTISNPFNFQGLPRDPETGFVYMRNRYYDPELGRFIAVDPLGYVDGPNAYGFAVNDPVNHCDRLGLDALFVDPFSGKTRVFTNGQEFYAFLMAADKRTTTEQATEAVIAAGLGADINAESVTGLARGVDTSVKQQLVWSGKTYVVTAVGMGTFGGGTAVFGTGWLGVTAAGGLSGISSNATNDLLSWHFSGIGSYGYSMLLGAGGGALAKGIGSFELPPQLDESSIGFTDEMAFNRGPIEVPRGTGALYDLLQHGRQVSGRFPRAAGPNEVLLRRDAAGRVTHYQVFDEQGLPLRRVDVTGRAHGDIPSPHVLEFERHVNPTNGEVFVKPGPIRPALPGEIP